MLGHLLIPQRPGILVLVATPKAISSVSDEAETKHEITGEMPTKKMNLGDIRGIYPGNLLS